MPLTMNVKSKKSLNDSIMKNTPVLSLKQKNQTKGVFYDN